MKSSETLRISPDSYADAPLGRDAGRDNALYWAAVTIFAVVGVAIVGVGALWLSARERPVAQGIDLFEDANAPVSADMPMLRQGFAGDDTDLHTGSFTFLDGSTGMRAIVEVAPPARGELGPPVITR